MVYYPVSRDEAILDRVDVDNRAIKTGIASIDQVAPNKATVWGFSPGNKEPVPLRWSDGAHADGQLMEKVTKAGKFLARASLTNVLAVMTRDNPFPIGSNEILLERTNEQDRTQLTTVVPRSSVSEDQAAAWYFRLAESHEAAGRGHVQPVDVIPVAMRGCDPGC